MSTHFLSRASDSISGLSHNNPGFSCESSDVYEPRDVYETIASNRNSLEDIDRISRTLALEDSSVNVYHGYESTES